MGKREPVALLILSSWCLLMVERLFLAVPRGCLRFVIVVFPDHTRLLFMISKDALPSIHYIRYLSISCLLQPAYEILLFIGHFRATKDQASLQ